MCRDGSTAVTLAGVAQNRGAGAGMKLSDWIGCRRIVRAMAKDVFVPVPTVVRYCSRSGLFKIGVMPDRGYA
jgi:hypothetical protein